MSGASATISAASTLARSGKFDAWIFAQIAAAAAGT